MSEWLTVEQLAEYHHDTCDVVKLNVACSCSCGHDAAAVEYNQLAAVARAAGEEHGRDGLSYDPECPICTALDALTADEGGRIVNHAGPCDKFEGIGECNNCGYLAGNHYAKLTADDGEK